MKPVAVFRHTLTEGPGYFATFLQNKNIPLELIKIDEGAPVPNDPGAYAGLVFMGRLSRQREFAARRPRGL